jgi:hypothetical protein
MLAIGNSPEGYSFLRSHSSNRKEFHLAGPFLRFTRGPDEKQALDPRRSRHPGRCLPGNAGGSSGLHAGNRVERAEPLHHGLGILRGVLTHLIPQLLLSLKVLIDFISIGQTEGRRPAEGAWFRYLFSSTQAVP